MSIVLRFFPNGEFTQGVDSTSSKKHHKRTTKTTNYIPLTKELKEQYLCYRTSCDSTNIAPLTIGQQFLSNSSGGVYTYLCEDVNGHHFCYENGDNVLADVLINEPIGRLIAKGELTPLVHQEVESSSNSQKPSRKRLDAMTKNMARNIRQACYLLEMTYGKDCLSFLTLTLPGLSTDELKTCCQHWDDMVDYFLVWLRKKLHKRGLQFEYVYCTEIQSKRLKNNKGYAPHLHIVYRGRYGRKAPWAVSPKQVRKAWAGIIANFIGRRNFDCSALENLQRIQKSASRYLSKYLSKGKCCNPTGCNEGHQEGLHTQWGGMARELARRIKKCTVKLSSQYDDGGLAICILRAMPSLIKSGIVRYFKQGFVPLGVCPVTGVERVLKVGSGCLATPTYEAGLGAVIESLGRESLA